MKKTILLSAAMLVIINPAPSRAEESSTADEMFKKMAKQLARVEKKLPNKTVAVYVFEVIGKPDDTYGQTSGTHVFDPVPPGNYAIRVYFNWSRDGYIVRKRLKLTVK